MDKLKKTNEQWNKMFNLASSYYNHHGNLNVPQKFKTINGYDYDENGKSLGMWIATQRTVKNITDEQRQQLLSIGMNFYFKKRRLDSARKIYLLEQFGISEEYHGKLINFSYDELSQKLNFFMKNKIPLVVKGNINSLLYLDNEELFLKYNIVNEEKEEKQIDNKEQNKYFRKKDYETIRKVILLEQFGLYTHQIAELINIPYEELVIKIDILKQNKIPLVVNKKVNELFFLDIEEIKVKYNIDVSKYKISNKKGKTK